MEKSGGEERHRRVLELYEESRYLEAYSLFDPQKKLTGSEGTLRDRMGELPLSDLVLAGRLLEKLGNRDARETAIDLAADLPCADDAVNDDLAVLWLSSMSNMDPLGALRRYEDPNARRPQSERSRSYWHAAGSLLYAAYRDFARADEALARAETEGSDRPWLSYCRSQLHIRRDDWRAAWELARESWLSPAPHPFGAHLLHLAAVRLGCLEACLPLLGAVENQSYEVELMRVSAATWLLDRMGAAASPQKVSSWQEEALERLAEARRKAVAADAVVAAHFRHVEDQIRTQVKARARSVLTHVPVFQAYQLCQPAAIATALSTQGIAFDIRPLVAQIAFNGTSTIRVRDWLQREGFQARIGTLSRQIAAGLLELGIGFVLAVAGEESGHSLTVLGFRRDDDMLVIHDPAGDHLVDVPMDFLLRLYEPLGPEVLVAYPPARDQEVSRVWEKDGQDPSLEAFLEYRQLLADCNGTDAAAAAARVSENRPGIRRLVSVYELHRSGREREARLQLQSLRGSWPGSLPLVVETMRLAEEITDEKELEELVALATPMAEAVTDTESAPGENQRPLSAFLWVQQSLLVIRARYLGQSAGDMEEALSLLRGALSLNPVSPRALDALAAVLLRHGRAVEAELPSRLAFCLDPASEEPARVRSQYLEMTSGAEADQHVRALHEKRVASLGAHPLAGAIWESYLHWAFEKLDRDAFTAVLEEARRSRPDLPYGWYCAVLNAARSADYDRVAALLCSPPAGRWERVVRVRLALDGYVRVMPAAQAAALAREWALSEPSNREAQYACLQLLRHTEGTDAALAWAESQPGVPGDNAVGTEVLYRAHRQNHDTRTVRELLLRQVKANPRDGWAWRELGFLSLEEGDMDAGAAFLEKAEGVEPASPAVLHLRILSAQAQQNAAQTAGILLRGLALLPPSPLMVQKALEHLQSCRAGAEDEVFEALCAVAGTFASTRDICEDLLALKARSADIRSCLEWAQRQSDRAERREIREAWTIGMIRFILGVPFEEELQARAEQLAEQLLPALPAGTRGWTAAALLARRGRSAEALEHYKRILACDPGATGAWDHAARSLAALARHADALDTVIQGIESTMDNPAATAALARLLGDLGAAPRAHAVASGLVRRYPNEADAWSAYRVSCMRMGCTSRFRAEIRCARERASSRAVLESLLREEAYTAGPPAEDGLAALREAWAQNPRSLETSDVLAAALAEAGNLEEAERVMKGLPAPGTASRGRLAWLAGRAGRWAEAYKAMAAVLADHPEYAWGWAVFQEWAASEKDGPDACEFAAAAVSLQEVLSLRPFEATGIISAWARALGAQSELEQLTLSVAAAWRTCPERLLRLTAALLPAAQGGAALRLTERIRLLALEGQPALATRALELLDLSARRKARAENLEARWRALRLPEPLGTDLERAFLEACILLKNEHCWMAGLLVDLAQLTRGEKTLSEEEESHLGERVVLAAGRAEVLAPAFSAAVEAANEALGNPIERVRPYFPHTDLLATLLSLLPRKPRWDNAWHCLLEGLEAQDATTIGLDAWEKSSSELMALRQTSQYFGYLLLKRRERRAAADWLEGCASRDVDMWCVHNECIARFQPFDSLRRDTARREKCEKELDIALDSLSPDHSYRGILLRRLACALWSRDDAAFLRRWEAAEDFLAGLPERGELFPPELAWLSRLAGTFSRAMRLPPGAGPEVDGERASLTQEVLSRVGEDTPAWALREWRRRFFPSSGRGRLGMRLRLLRSASLWSRHDKNGQTGKRAVPWWAYIALMLLTLSLLRVCAQ